MKKSELLALLKHDIKDAAGDLDLQAGMVLARCLSIGMLPPPDDAEAVTRSIVYLTYKGRVVDNKDGAPIVSLLWEPEDET
jgi:hypothetical protein